MKWLIYNLVCWLLRWMKVLIMGRSPGINVPRGSLNPGSQRKDGKERVSQHPDVSPRTPHHSCGPLCFLTGVMALRTHSGFASSPCHLMSTCFFEGQQLSWEKHVSKERGGMHLAHSALQCEEDGFTLTPAPHSYTEALKPSISECTLVWI